jgi:hypothetical protein
MEHGIGNNGKEKLPTGQKHQAKDGWRNIKTFFKQAPKLAKCQFAIFRFSMSNLPERFLPWTFTSA